ncbi:MAG: hypothetical protein AB7G28_15275 [Pirellulales bacterium]
MPIQVTCPSCSSSFKAPDSAAGKKAKCPKCAGTIEIPAAAPAEEIVDAEIAPNRPFDDDDFAVEPPAAVTVAAADRKNCPMCGELIQKDAVKCRFCGEVFDPVLRAKEAKSKGSPGDDDLSTGEWVLAIICSGIGCIMGIIWMIQGKPKGKKMFLVSFCMQIVWGLVRLAIEAAANR